MLRLAHHQGRVAGLRYAESLLSPAHTMRPPACPYWRPCRRAYWFMGLESAIFETVYQR